jgi:lipopolysaccharide biosynthesis glycosyltransferase
MGVYTRERGQLESTEFSMTRFLTPYLSGYEGISIFMDCDFLCRADIADLLIYPLAHPSKAVHVCQHDYTPSTKLKFLYQPQTMYPRKNWSSLMVFNNAECRMLTPDYVNMATGLELHRFNWLKDEQIGALPLEFNWLVSEYSPTEKAKMLHFTNGGPWFEQYMNTDNALDWTTELQEAFSAKQVEVV